MKRYDAILRSFNNSVWAILPQKMDAILGFLDIRAAGMMIDGATVERMAAGNRSNSKAVVNRSVAVLPIVGTISQRIGMLEESSGGISSERIGQELDALLKDDQVGAIILDVDSPGGNYAGTPELANKIMAARGVKPIVAVANSMAASAAYWIASAADQIVVTPSGEVGSIGVLAVHYDESAANEAEGVKPTYVIYGKHKAEFASDAPLSAEAKDELQRRVDMAGENFIRAVAANRKTTHTNVRENFGQGRMFSAQEAVDRGMADRVGTLEAEIERLATGGKAPRSTRRAEIARERLALEQYRR